MNRNDHPLPEIIGSWQTHYKSWKNNKQFRVLFLRYEDLENNTLDKFNEISVSDGNTLEYFGISNTSSKVKDSFIVPI